MAEIAVMGAGSWGTAFSLVLADVGNSVRIWARRPDVCRSINDEHVNTEYLPGVALPEQITSTTDAADALEAAEIVVLAMPSQVLRENLSRWREHIPDDAIIVSLLKGLESGTHQRMSQVIADVTGIGDDRIAVVSGPNLAREIANREPAASVVACVDHDVAEHVQRICHSRWFRPYTNTDVIGCELGGVTKNVIGLAVGVCVGLGYGDNTKASVITRGLAETVRLGAAMGAEAMTFMGLAGMGDLVATCSSPLSRNRSFGAKLGEGLSVDEAAAQTAQVAEGVNSCQALAELARMHGVDMPIVDNVAELIAGRATPDHTVAALISREAKPEVRG